MAERMKKKAVNFIYTCINIQNISQKPLFINVMKKCNLYLQINGVQTWWTRGKKTLVE
jgi:hypothetical protein